MSQVVLLCCLAPIILPVISMCMDKTAQQQLDAVLHLGDYVYKYEQGGYATERSVELGRALAADNQAEMVSYQDYRKRYALYRSDKDLQQAHASHSFICISNNMK